QVCESVKALGVPETSGRTMLRYLSEGVTGSATGHNVSPIGTPNASGHAQSERGANGVVRRRLVGFATLLPLDTDIHGDPKVTPATVCLSGNGANGDPIIASVEHDSAVKAVVCWASAHYLSVL